MQFIKFLDKSNSVFTTYIIAVVLLFVCTGIAKEKDAKNATAPASNLFHFLSDSGDVSTPEKAQTALDKLASKLMASGGGLIVITNQVAKDFRPENTYQTERTNGPTVTILDVRHGYFTVLSPQIGFDHRANWSGTHFKRSLNLKGESLPHWGNTAVTNIENNIISGSSSIYKTILFPAKAGKDVKVYPSGVVSLWVGAKVNLISSHAIDRQITIKSIEWDPQKRLNYITTDLQNNHPAGAQLVNKHNVNALVVNSHSNADNQTFFLDARTHQWGVGDAFTLSCVHTYQSNIHSGLGDEGAVCLNAESIHDLDAFRSVVESFDPQSGALVYQAGTVNTHKLSMSRPMINLNPHKWLTQGRVKIVRPGVSYRGKTWGTIKKQEIPHPGGLIIGSRDVPWDEKIIGRYFALDEDTEKYQAGELPGGYWPAPAEHPVRRWYLITDLERLEDGTKRLRVQRVFWHTHNAGSINLFRDDNYTWDGHERPLKYIIAPGGLCYDISKGWTDTRTRRHGRHYVTLKSDPRTLMIAPNGDRGTAFDFAPGDPIVQAVGPDPWVPQPIRIRMFDEFPASLPNPAINIHNNGSVSRSDGILFWGRAETLDDLKQLKDNKPPYVNGISFRTVVGTGIRFMSEVQDAAILMEQPEGNPQPIAWKHKVNGAWGSTRMVGRPADGDLVVSGGALNLEQSSLRRASITEARGISTTQVAAKNLRGINVLVTPGIKQMKVRFLEIEADSNYALNIQPTWFTEDRIAEKRKDGFTVEFSKAPDKLESFDWFLIR